jgi:hypothetical protein
VRQFIQKIGHQFTRTTIRVTALTGAAATEIGGETTAREFSLMSDRDYATAQDISDFTDTRMNVVDEISFAGYDSVLRKLSARLQSFTQCRDYPFGSIPIVFLGDFCQLEPIGGDCIYKQANSMLWEQALTCMVELRGSHRYKHCPVMTEVMPRTRDHGLSEVDRQTLNSRVIDGVNVKMPELATTRFATYYNVNRCGINAGIFRDYLKKHHSTCDPTNIPTTAVVIKTNPRWKRSGRSLSFDQRKVFFEECSENDVKTTGSFSKRIDPLLCLSSNCPMMGSENKDVANGIANGTTSVFRKVHLKQGKKPYPIQLHGYWVYAVDIGDVDHLEMQWKDSRFEGKFKLKPQTSTCRANFPVYEYGTRMVLQAGIKIDHFAVVVNYATTGHKLQGKSLDELVIAELSKVKNWAYVVLSRVRTLSGLFLMKAIPANINFAPDGKYLSMMARLRTSVLAVPEHIDDLWQRYQTEYPDL